MSPESFELQEESPIAWHLEIAALTAMEATGAHIIGVERIDGRLRMTFDRTISQELIAHLLELLIESASVRPDVIA